MGLLNGKQVHELSTICHATKLRDRAKAVVFKLKNELPRQQFAIAIQVSSLVESVHLSGLGHCGHYTTYTAFPDMNKEVWTCLKESLLNDYNKVKTMKLTMLD